jgi:putative GTP pyrophosphokinase
MQEHHGDERETAHISLEGEGIFMALVVADVVETTYIRRRQAWQEALDQANGWLKRQCEAALSDEQDMSRLVVDKGRGRIKDSRRATRKILDKVEAEDLDVDGLDSAGVENAIGDLAATKVLCKSTRDQELIMGRLVETAGAPDAGLDLVGQPKDYVHHPKPSGYRANHLTLLIPVAGEDAVKVEVQIKTMLQDAWGELTHENSYKPGSAIKKKDLHDEVARTMANLLHEVDRLADRLAEDMEGSLSEASDPSETEDGPDAAGGRTGAVDVAVGDIPVTVVHTGPKYALAEDINGERGLIRAVDVRDLAGERGLIDAGTYIRVDDYIRKDDELEVEVVEEGDSRLYKPQSLVEHHV